MHVLSFFEGFASLESGLEVFCGCDCVEREDFLESFGEPGLFVEVGVREDVDEGGSDLGVDVLLDVGEEDVNGKDLLDLFGADVVAIEGQVREEVDLGS